MIGCLKRVTANRSIFDLHKLKIMISRFKLSPDDIPDPKKIKEKIIEKGRDIRNDFRDPNGRSRKNGPYFLAYLALSLALYYSNMEKAEQISLEGMLEILTQSKTDEIHVFKNKTNPNRYMLKFYVDGVYYFMRTDNLEKTEKFIADVEKGKMIKTKIILIADKTWDQTMKGFLTVGVKIFLPLLFPLLLYTSKLGNIFKNNMLGQTDILTRPSVLFSDIAGLGNAKIEVSEIVDFLQNPNKYKKIGAKVPKGALLAGPPGTGKTMLAKACAGEANVPFFSVSGSEFVELFAGMGSRRVRELFANAKKQTPAIIFIDEIDAIGRKRQDKFGGANDERANTLNQLLVEMDGFSTDDDIIVLAATNRKEMLDSALTRPGRFDRIVEIQLPDLSGRKEILELYLDKLKLSPKQALEDYSRRIATLTFGFSGADLANLCNEAAILAVRKEKEHVEPEDFQSASDRVLAGLEMSTPLSKLEKKKVAYHECGHAVTAWFLEGASPLLKITIVPRSKGSLGFAQYLPNESTLSTKEDLADQMCVILGGRTAEEIFFGEVTNGASDDLMKVRKLARAMLVTYGMSNDRMNYAPVQTDGHNIYSEITAMEIDKEVIKLIAENTERTRRIIQQHRDKIEALAEAVLEKQVLNHGQIRRILGERPFATKENYQEFLEEIKKEDKASEVV